MSQGIETKWWITTNFFDKGGEKVLGPYASMQLALEARRAAEASTSAAYYIDFEEGTS